MKGKKILMEGDKMYAGRRKLFALLLVISLLVLSGNLKAKERRGADLIIQKKDGQQVKGELITVKIDSLLLLDSESLADVTVDISDVKVINIVKKSKASGRALLGLLIGGGGGALLGYSIAGNYPRTRIAGIYGAIGAGLGLLFTVGLTSETNEKDELIQMEGKSRREIIIIIGNLRSKARIPDFHDGIIRDLSHEYQERN